MTGTVIVIIALYALAVIYSLTQIDFWIRRIFHGAGARWVIAILYLLICAIPVIGAFTGNQLFSNWSQHYSNIWMSVWIYFCGMLLILHILRFPLWIVRLIRGKKAPEDKDHSAPAKALIALCFCLCVSLTTAAVGYGTAHRITMTHYDVSAQRDVQMHGSMKIALVSDLHLGVNSNLKLMKSMVKRINKEKPDIILIAGDIFNSSYQGLNNPDKYIEVLSELEAKQGVYGVYGSHDVVEPILAGISLASPRDALRSFEMTDFLEQCGIQMLEDEVIYADGVQIVGRKDELKTGDGTTRAKVEDLVASLDTTLPILFLEHEPSDLQMLSASDCDLVLSGHTHAGQFFPITAFLPLFSENPYGMLDLGDMTSIVTSGVGYSGPPIRVGTVSEVAIIDFSY